MLVKYRSSPRHIFLLRTALLQIFDPGLTTKGVVAAAGLAQSISYNIVPRRKGRMQVQIDVGQGTEMAIYIPTDLVEPAADEKENG